MTEGLDSEFFINCLMCMSSELYRLLINSNLKSLLVRQKYEY